MSPWGTFENILGAASSALAPVGNLAADVANSTVDSAVGCWGGSMRDCAWTALNVASILPEGWLPRIARLGIESSLGEELLARTTAQEGFVTRLFADAESTAQRLGSTSSRLGADEVGGVLSGGPARLSEGVSSTGVPAEHADEAFHYTVLARLDSIQKEGLLPGQYATPTGNLSPLQAHIELSLPPNTPLRDAVVRIDLARLREAGFNIPEIRRVSNVVHGPGRRVYSMPGGGSEMQFPYSVPPEFLSVVRP
jgi:hypothetical protein